MEERRGIGRTRTFLKGRIVFNNHHSTMDCTVRDLSTAGARLALGDTTGLPDVFELDVPHKERHYSCRLSWRAAGEVGVEFLDMPPADATPAELLRLIAELKAENSDLRRRLSRTARPATSAA